MTEIRNENGLRNVWLERHRYSHLFPKDTYRSSKKTNIVLAILLVLGIMLLVYPSAADYWNNFYQRRAILDYAKQVASMNSSQYDEQISEARKYNERMALTGIRWTFAENDYREYEKQLAFNESGNMGFIDIPKINVQLPMYHGVSEDVLLTSIGHIPETSLPVGGMGSHCVLSGHRGLPSAKLFSDLDKLVEGDTFTLSVLNETCTYEVDRIRVVAPTDMAALNINPGEDLCTLVTCTPYGVNSHRLLVRGHRVENANGNAQVVADAMQMEPAFVAPFIMIPMITGLLLVLFAFNPGRAK